jgi:delta 1-pyrroline-5-carboxylate dehydrogenase
MGALMMGNRPTLKPAEQTSLVMEQFVRLLHHCGVPKTDVSAFVGGGGGVGGGWRRGILIYGRSLSFPHLTSVPLFFFSIYFPSYF